MKEYKFTINDKKYEVAINGIENDVADVTVNGESFKVAMEPEPKPEKPVVVVPKPVAKPVEAPAVKSSTASAEGHHVVSPLPGTIIEVNVQVGDEVTADTQVLVLEAMKMSNSIEAEKAGKVVQVCVQPGQTVMEGDALVIIG